MENEFDIEVDGSDTLVFCITENKWRGSDQYSCDGLSNFGGSLYSYKNGELWQHNVSGEEYNLFFGDAVSSYIGVMATGEGGKIKTMSGISVEGNRSPSSVKIKATLPKQSVSELTQANFRGREGVFSAAFRRAGTGEDRISGKKVRGPFVYCLVEFSGTTKLQLRFINLSYNMSFGHEFI